MANMTRDALRSLIGSRVDIALERLEGNLEYLKTCKEQENTEGIVEELYQQFEKSDRITIRNHYEGEVHKTNLEIKEVYLQGLRDCFKLFAFLGDEGKSLTKSE